MVFARERIYFVADAERFGFCTAALMRRNDGNPLSRYVDVAQQQRQDTLRDGAETDENDFPLEFEILLICHFINWFCRFSEAGVYQFLCGAHSKTGPGPAMAIMSIKSTRRRLQNRADRRNPGNRHG